MPRGGARLEELLDPSLGLRAGRPHGGGARCRSPPHLWRHRHPPATEAAAAPVEMPEQPPPATGRGSRLHKTWTPRRRAESQRPTRRAPENLFGLDFPISTSAPEELRTPAAMPQAAVSPSAPMRGRLPPP